MFPAVGDVVVCLRNGCLIQLDKYVGLARHFPVHDLLEARMHANTMQAAERLRVVAIGYRRWGDMEGKMSCGEGALLWLS